MNRMRMAKEAETRMKMLQLYDVPGESIIYMFLWGEKVFVSKPAMGNRIGVLCEPTEAEKRLVKEFEEKYGYLVYHIIRNEMEAGVMYSLLYISDKVEEWAEETNALKDADCYVVYQKAYVYSAGYVSEECEDLSGGSGKFMEIGLAIGAGGLCRVR